MARHKPNRAAGPLRVADRVGGMRALGRRFSLMAGLAAAVSCFVAPVQAGAGTAPAGSLARAEAQAKELSERALADARRAHLLTVAYGDDVRQDAALRQQVAASRSALRRLRAKACRTESLLRQEALFAYTGSMPADDVPTTGGFVAASDRQEYLDLAVGNLTDTMDRYRLEQAEVSQRVTELKAELDRAVAVATQAAAARHNALSAAAAVGPLLDKARYEVSTLKAQARARAAAAVTGPPVANGVLDAVDQQLKSAGGTATAPEASAGQPNFDVPAPVTTTTAPATATTAAAVRNAVALRAPTTTTPSTTTPSTTTPSTTTPSTTTVPTTTTVVTTTVVTTTVPTTTTAPTTTVVTTTTTSPPTTVPAAAPDESAHPAPLGGVWLQLRQCESSDNYEEDTGNGFYGAYQFSAATWADLGFTGRPDLEPYWVQDEAAQKLQAEAGWSQWPDCSAALGL